MTEPKPPSGNYLPLFEAASWLAFKSDAGAVVTRRIASEKAGRSPDDTDTTLIVFSTALACLRDMAAKGVIRVWGRRPHQARIELIPIEYWINGILDPIGEDGGSAYPGPVVSSDYEAESWIGLRFNRVEIEALGRADDAANPDSRPKATGGEKGKSGRRAGSYRSRLKDFLRWYDNARPGGLDGVTKTQLRHDVQRRLLADGVVDLPRSRSGLDDAIQTVRTEIEAERRRR